MGNSLNSLLEQAVWVDVPEVPANSLTIGALGKKLSLRSLRNIASSVSAARSIALEDKLNGAWATLCPLLQSVTMRRLEKGQSLDATIWWKTWTRAIELASE